MEICHRRTHPDQRNPVTPKPRIAVIGSKGIPSRVSGLEVYVEEICTELADDYDITVFCRKRYCDEIVERYRGVDVSHVPSVNTKHLDAITYSLLATLRAMVGGYDLFWYHALGPAITACLPGVTGKRILSTVHGLDWKRAKFGRLSSSMLKLGERAIARFADEIIVLSESDRRHFMEAWGRETHLVRNGVSICGSIGLGEAGRGLRLERGGYVLFASRIVPEKNVHVLIEAFKMSGIEKKLVIAGDGVHTDGYVDEVRWMAGNDERIVFAGHVGEEMLWRLYSNAFCYVLPSTIEGQSIGLLEAMSHRLPCIVSDIPENREVAGDGALHFRTGDAEDLACCLRLLEERPDIAEAIAGIALETVREKHSRDGMVEFTRRVIERCLSSAHVVSRATRPEASNG